MRLSCVVHYTLFTLLFVNVVVYILLYYHEGYLVPARPVHVNVLRYAILIRRLVLTSCTRMQYVVKERVCGHLFAKLELILTAVHVVTYH